VCNSTLDSFEIHKPQFTIIVWRLNLAKTHLIAFDTAEPPPLPRGGSEMLIKLQG